LPQLGQVRRGFVFIDLRRMQLKLRKALGGPPGSREPLYQRRQNNPPSLGWEADALSRVARFHDRYCSAFGNDRKLEPRNSQLAALRMVAWRIGWRRDTREGGLSKKPRIQDRKRANRAELLVEILVGQAITAPSAGLVFTVPARLEQSSRPNDQYSPD